MKELAGYRFWIDRTSNHHYRWACKSVPSGYDRKHGQHHGGANTQEEAYAAALRHKELVKQLEELHP